MFDNGKIETFSNNFIESAIYHKTLSARQWLSARNLWRNEKRSKRYSLKQTKIGLRRKFENIKESVKFVKSSEYFLYRSAPSVTHLLNQISMLPSPFFSLLFHVLQLAIARSRVRRISPKIDLSNASPRSYCGIMSRVTGSKFFNSVCTMGS